MGDRRVGEQPLHVRLAVGGEVAERGPAEREFGHQAVGHDAGRDAVEETDQVEQGAEAPDAPGEGGRGKRPDRIGGVGLLRVHRGAPSEREP